MPRPPKSSDTASAKSSRVKADPIKDATKGRPGRKPKALTDPDIKPLSLAGNAASEIDNTGLKAILTQTETALAQLIHQIDSLEKQLHELEKLRTQRQQLESLKHSIHLLITPSSVGKSTKPADAPKTSSQTAADTETKVPAKPGRKPNALKLQETADSSPNETGKKRGPGRPKTVGRKIPKNIGKGNYVFIPELAFEQSKETIKRRESVNFELFKAIVLNGGVASSEDIRNHLIENDVRQPNKQNASFEDVALTDISSRVSYLVTKGAVQPRGKGVFASSYGWQKGDGTQATFQSLLDSNTAESDETHAPQREEALV